MPFRRPACAALAGLAVAWLAAAGAVAAPSVQLSASFDRGARLGGSTAVDVALRLDPRSVPPAPLVGVELDYPSALGLVSSGLGLAACTRPASDFSQVLIAASGLAGCPPNAVMGYGAARATVRLLGNGQAIAEYASVTLLAGPLAQGRLGLVVFVDGQRPFGAKLVFAGAVRGARPPYGGTLSVRMPLVPGIRDVAALTLTELSVTIGSRAIRYYERRGGRTVAYRPAGVALPRSCPSRGFPFRVRVLFADGSRRGAVTTAPCPRSARAVHRLPSS